MIYNSFNFIVLFPLIFFLYYAIPARYGKVALSLDKKKVVLLNWIATFNLSGAHKT